MKLDWRMTLIIQILRVLFWVFHHEYIPSNLDILPRETPHKSDIRYIRADTKNN
jgi:hypothetical protein